MNQKPNKELKFLALALKNRKVENSASIQNYLTSLMKMLILLFFCSKQMDLKILAVVAVLFAVSGAGASSSNRVSYPDTLDDITCELVQREQWHDLIQKVALAVSGKARAYVHALF